MNRQNRAFTLLEVMIAIVVMLILTGILVYGVKSATEATRVSSTKVMLENGRSLLAEYTSPTTTGLGLPTQPLRESVLPTSVGVDGVSAERPLDPLGRYGLGMIYTRGAMARLMQNPSVRKMVEAMPSGQLLQIPNGGLDVLQGIPQFTPPASVVPPDPFNVYPFDMCQVRVPALPPGPYRYYAYICSTSHVDDASASPTNTHPREGDASPALWLELGLYAYDGDPSAGPPPEPAVIPPNCPADRVPVLLDAFGNPLFFIPACGFVTGSMQRPVPTPCRLVTSAGTFTLRYDAPDPNGAEIRPFWVDARSYQVDDVVAFDPSLTGAARTQWQIYRCTTNHTAATTNAPNVAGSPWVLTPTKPFFASAGPDGVFAPGPGDDGVLGTADDTHPNALDDNLYSFEN